MNKRTLSESQVANILDLVQELERKVKRKNDQLNVARQRLANAKQTIRRLQGVIAFQRERILDLRREQNGPNGRSHEPLTTSFSANNAK